MDRLGVVVAALVLASGCNAIGGTAPAPTETVTPVAVPTVETTEPTATDRPDCAAPRPGPAPVSTPPPRADPLALPGEGDRINGTELARLHGRTLSNYSFHLRAGSSGEVWSLPDAAAFAYEGTGLGVESPWAYAISGRLYTLETDNGRLVLDERPYGSDAPTRERLRRVLTGERWLTDLVGQYNYTVAGTDSYRGTDVRVLRDTLENSVLRRPDPRAGALLYVNSTLYVDRHGIVRGVRHVERFRYGPNMSIPNETRVMTFDVDRVGTADLHRPAAFCVSEPSAMRTATPTRGANATVIGSSVEGANATDAPTGRTTTDGGMNTSTPTPIPTPTDTPTAHGTPTGG